MSNTHNNPLSGYFRSPKLYARLPTMGRFYEADVLEMPETGELPVFAMTAKDEMIMKNPDALLNGEAVAQVIKSCVPAVKKPRSLISNDVDTLLIAIQGATQGDDIEITGKCPTCGAEDRGTVSVEGILETMTTLEESYTFDLPNGLTIEIRPFTYESTVKAGVANFKTTRSLQSLTNIEDEMEQMRAFNENFQQIAALNFELVVDSVGSISGTDSEGEKFIVTDRSSIREFMENTESSVGKQVEERIKEVNAVGVNKKVMLNCEEHGEFEHEVAFDPVNFSTAS